MYSINKITGLKKQNPLKTVDDSIELINNEDGTVTIKSKSASGDFITNDELNKILEDYTKKSELSEYAKKSDLANYAKTSDLENYAKKTYVDEKETDLKQGISEINTKWNNSVGYNDGGGYYFQVRNIEKEFFGLNSVRNFLKDKFKTRSNFVGRGGIIVYATNDTSLPYWLAFEISGSSEPSETDNLIITFVPQKKELHINGKLKINSLFSLQIKMSDFNIINCYISQDIISRYNFDEELINYFFNEGRITLTSVMGLNFGKINWVDNVKNAPLYGGEEPSLLVPIVPLIPEKGNSKNGK